MPLGYGAGVAGGFSMIFELRIFNFKLPHSLLEWGMLKVVVGGRLLGLPQKTTDFPDRPAKSAPVRPGLPVRFAIALSTSTFSHPQPRATTQSHAATLPYRFNPLLKAPHRINRSREPRMNPPLMTTFMESIV